MELVHLKCKSCGGQLKINGNIASCNFCNSNFYVSDDNIKEVRIKGLENLETSKKETKKIEYYSETPCPHCDSHNVSYSLEKSFTANKSVLWWCTIGMCYLCFIFYKFIFYDIFVILYKLIKYKKFEFQIGLKRKSKALCHDCGYVYNGK